MTSICKVAFECCCCLPLTHCLRERYLEWRTLLFVRLVRFHGDVLAAGLSLGLFVRGHWSAGDAPGPGHLPAGLLHAGRLPGLRQLLHGVVVGAVLVQVLGRHVHRLCLHRAGGLRTWNIMELQHQAYMATGLVAHLVVLSCRSIL